MIHLTGDDPPGFRPATGTPRESDGVRPDTVVASANVLSSLAASDARRALGDVLAEQPDLIGLQEWSLFRFSLLRETGTAQIVLNRPSRTPSQMEPTGYRWNAPALGGCPVGARSDRFDLLSCRCVLLNWPEHADKPDRPWRIEPPRVATLAVYRDRFGDRPVSLLNFHLTPGVQVGGKYRSDRPLLVLGIIGANLAAFAMAYLLNDAFPERVPVAELSTVGMISVSAATIYNSMMAIYYAYVVVAQSALQQEIGKHIETSAKLRIAKQDAERANEAKAVFLAKMSHQLRTPLNAIIGYSEILLEDSEASEQPVDTDELRSINSAGRHLLSLVSDVLHMPKIDSEDVDVRLHSVDLDQCLDEVSATCRNLISQNGNSFALEKLEALGMMQTDELRLRQILINLLGNAGKFTKNGKVVLRARRLEQGNNKQLLISVQDTGIGIPSEAISKLFKNFNQVNPDLYGGSGLGLAVSQKLAQLLQGEISVESRLSRGSEFTLRLPVVTSAIATAA